METSRRDAGQPGGGDGVPAELLRLQYAMSIVRLVNGIADSAQKGRTALSVASLAEDAGACVRVYTTAGLMRTCTADCNYLWP